MIDNRNTLAVLLKQIRKACGFDEFANFVFELFEWLGANSIYLKAEELNQNYFLTYFIEKNSEVKKSRTSIDKEKEYLKSVFPQYQTNKIKEFSMRAEGINIQNIELKIFWEKEVDLKEIQMELDLLQPVLTLKMEQLQLDSKISKYEQMLANSMDVMMLLENKELEYISPQAFKYLGYSRKELTEAVRSRDIFHPGDQKEIEKRIVKDNIKKKPFSKREYRVKLKDGKFRWIQWVVRRIFDENGDVLRMILNFRDITEKKEAEEEIAHQKLFLQEILDRLPIEIYLKDLNGKYIFINKSAADTMGIKQSDILGKSDNDLFSKEIAHKNIKEDRLIFEGSHYQEVKEIKKRKKQVVYLVNKQLVKVDKRNVLLAYSVDISEQKKNEEKLLESTEFINKSIQIIPDSIFIFDLSNFSYVFTNDKIFKKLGYEKKDIGGDLKTFIKSIIHEEDVNSYFDQLVEIRKGKKELYELEYRVYDLNRNVHWLYSKKSPMKRNSHGQVDQFVGLTFDITEQKSKEQKLRNTSKKLEKALNAREEFLSIISHEIRTPLNAILGIANLLEQSMPEAEREEMLKILKNSGENLLVIINDILDFSKMRADELQFDLSTFNIKSLVSNLCGIYQPQIKDKGLSFDKFFDENISDFIKGDPLRLTQILNNLISNAIKFTDKGKVSCSVRIAQEDDKNQVIEFKISDTGIGIPESEQKSIFDPFRQISSKTTRKYGGTGLGLSITKALIEKQGGVLNVKSQDQRGSEFSAILTFKKANHKEENESDLKNSIVPFQEGKYKALYVEDVPSNRYLMRAYCHRINLNLVEVESGMLALEQFRTNHFDLILMDLNMPVMDGFETMKELKKEQKQVPPVIALTADVSTKIAEKIKSYGMIDYISKPMRIELLYQKIKNVLEPDTLINSEKVKDANGNKTTVHQKLLEIYGNKAEYTEYIRQVIDEIEHCEKELIQAIQLRDSKYFGEIFHKLIAPIGMFELDQLEDSLNAIKFKIIYGDGNFDIMETIKTVKSVFDKSKVQIDEGLTETV